MTQHQKTQLLCFIVVWRKLCSIFKQGEICYISCEIYISNFFPYLIENTELCTQIMHDKVTHETLRIHQYATNRTDTAANPITS